MIPLKSKQEIDIMDEANKIVHDVLNQLVPHISNGRKTRELDTMAKRLVLELNATPTFKGYMGYPSSICVSINEEVVHGIPGERIIQDGDIVSIDLGVTYKGFVGDAAKTIIVGDAPEKTKLLSKHTKEALKAGINQMRVGRRLHHIGEAIDSIATEYGYGNLRNFCGHGIGKNMHEEPSVYNYIVLGLPSVRLREGMVLALEPMFTLGSNCGEVLDDKWTVVTRDRSLAAHWEVSVAVTDDEPRVLGISFEDI